MNSILHCQSIYHGHIENIVPKNTAESTGRFPPTPTLSVANSEHRAISFGEAPAAAANTPVMRRVRLKHGLSMGM